jgi:hypothetical protein
LGLTGGVAVLLVAAAGLDAAGLDEDDGSSGCITAYKTTIDTTAAIAVIKSRMRLGFTG